MCDLASPADGRDPLTGLPDRYAGRTLLDAEFARSRQEQNPFSVLLLDIDRFKLINYGFSEQHGDRVLQEVAKVSSAHLHAEDRLIRWGGQEFLFLLPATGKTKAETLAYHLRTAVEKILVELGGTEMSITASLGLACYPDNGDHPSNLLGAAGAALHRAKSAGRNRVMTATDINSDLFGAGIRLTQALRDEKIIPAFQPIISLKDGNIVAEEALARLVEPGQQPLDADNFIRTAHELQLTHQIDRAIILRTFAHCAAALNNNVKRAHFVNISADLLRHQDVIDELLIAASDYSAVCNTQNYDVKPFVIEITERELFEDTAAVHDQLKPFLDFGLRHALDDFGSGFSSYKYLADLPFSFLKIEGSLIRRVTEPKIRHIVRGIQRTASDLGLITIAEYVESNTIAYIVRDLGIDWAQGYYFGRPVLPATG